MASTQALPSETLSTIFQLILGQPPPQSNAIQLLAQHRARIHKLIELSLVCRQWRNTALGDGTLWTTLPVDTSHIDCQQSTTTFLERSKQAMLDVSIVCDDDLDTTHETTFSEIIKNINRIKSLSFSTTSPGILRNLSVSAPNIETLDVFTAEQPAELGLLFGGNLPALRSLTLAGLPSWPLGLFSNLKDLYLVLPSSHPTVKVSSLIDIMSGSPGIKQIKMFGFLSIVDDSPPSSLAHLPNLQKFTMRDCDSATVLSHAIILATADVKVVTYHQRMRAAMRIPSHDCHILCLVPEDISTMGFLTGSTMFVLQQDHKIGFGVGFYRSRSSRPSLRIMDRSASPVSFARRTFGVLADYPQYLRNIKDISIALYTGGTVPWSTLLRGFGQVERLSMIALHASSLLSALMVISEDGRPICPTLKQVDIHERGDGHVVVLDRDDMINFFAARRFLDCAALEVKICGSGGDRSWKCRGSSGSTVETYV